MSDYAVLGELIARLVREAVQNAVVVPAEPQRVAYSLEEASRMLGVSYRTIKRLTAAEEIPAVRFGGIVLVRREALENWARRHEQGGQTCHEQPVSGVEERVFGARKSEAMAKGPSSIGKIGTNGSRK